jgi:hypothetical protein
VLAPTSDEVRYINFAQFPASYTINGIKSSGDQLKIIATSDHLIVYKDKDVVERVWELASFEKLDYKTFEVLTKDGTTVTVNRENNCGCGNSLRGYNPYASKPHIAHYPSLKGT